MAIIQGTIVGTSQSIQIEIPTVRIPELPEDVLPIAPDDQVPFFKGSENKTMWRTALDWREYFITGGNAGGQTPILQGADLEIIITPEIAANVDPVSGRVRVNVPALQNKTYTLERRGTGNLLTNEFLTYPSGGFELTENTSQPVEGDVFIAHIFELAGGIQNPTSTASGFLTEMIVQGFGNGKRAVSDFADDVEGLIRKAMLNALQYRALEGPLQKLYDQFAADAESGGGLDLNKVSKFQDGIANAIKKANEMAAQLEKATGVSLTAGNTGGSTNSLVGAIKGMTTQQADLLAGQFGGLRLTAIDQLRIVTSSLGVLNKIEANTAAAASTMERYYRRWDLEGLKVK